VYLRLQLVTAKILVFILIFDTTQASYEKVDEIYEKMEELIHLTNSKENIIIIKDWNVIVGEDTNNKEVYKCVL